MAYDVIVVGARAAGASTAMLLARQGMRVLLLDRCRYGTDTLSTHALMRAGVMLLSRWGLLDRIVEAGTPAVRRITFHYGDETIGIALKPTAEVDALYAPRRRILDRVLVDAAVAAGAEVRFGVTVTGVRRSGRGRVTGVDARDRVGTSVALDADLVVGADGARSTIARAVEAPVIRRGTSAGAVVYGYWRRLEPDGYEWFYRPGHSAGLIPTNDGETCVFAGTHAEALAGLSSTRLASAYTQLLETTGVSGKPPKRLRTWVGRPGFVRRNHGPGWALVGDAGSFLDPLSTHGITDALRDAELLARSIDDLDAFGNQHGRIVEPFFDTVDRIAGYDWDLAELQDLLRALSAAMARELAELEEVSGTTRPDRVPARRSS